MKLGDWIKNYRLKHDLSLQAFADLCGFSKAYAAILEKGINPSTGKPVSPTMQTFEKVAKVAGMDVNEFIELLDKDQTITLNSTEEKQSYYLDPETAKLVKELSDNPDLRNLLYEGRKLAPDDVKNIADIVAKMKKKENHDAD